MSRVASTGVKSVLVILLYISRITIAPVKIPHINKWMRLDFLVIKK